MNGDRVPKMQIGTLRIEVFLCRLLDTAGACTLSAISSGTRKFAIHPNAATVQRLMVT